MSERDWDTCPCDRCEQSRADEGWVTILLVPLVLALVAAPVLLALGYR